MTSTLPSNLSASKTSPESLPLPVSIRLRQRLEESGTPFFANDNISDVLREGDLEQLEIEVAGKVRELLRSLVIDIDNDHNTEETAERVARMYLHEVFKGRYHTQPKIASFPNVKKLDEIYTVGPISIRSACSHHLVPILGSCWIGIKPGDRVIGLSKFSRVADWVFSRPHIQEEAVIILADEIERLCAPQGLAILVKAQHYCMKWRGVKEPQTSMVNSVVRGDFRHDPSLKQEFFELVRQQEPLLQQLIWSQQFWLHHQVCHKSQCIIGQSISRMHELLMLADHMSHLKIKLCSGKPEDGVGWPEIWKLQGWEFAHLLIAHSLISLKSNERL